MPRSKAVGTGVDRSAFNKHIGALSELAACRWLLEQGYEVFRNMSQHGIADVVAWKPGGETLYIDVKKFKYEPFGDGSAYSYPARASAEQVAANVTFLYVCHNTWRVSFDHIELLLAAGFRQRGGPVPRDPKTNKGWRKGLDGTWFKSEVDCPEKARDGVCGGVGGAARCAETRAGLGCCAGWLDDPGECAMSGWHRMHSAPHDRTRVLVYGQPGDWWGSTFEPRGEMKVTIAFRDGSMSQWETNEDGPVQGFVPHCWMPLPAAPEIAP